MSQACLLVGVPTASITPILAGVGSGQQQTMEFTFYTAAAGGLLLQHVHTLEPNHLRNPVTRCRTHHTLFHKQTTLHRHYIFAA